MTDLFNRVGRSAFNYLSEVGGGVVDSDGFVGSVVEVDGMNVQVTKLLGEGGYAFIYAAKEISSGREFALKRFLVFEDIKVKEVVAEIRLNKELKGNPDFAGYVTAASVDHSNGKKVNKEFLLLMELCPGGDLAQLLRKTGESLSPNDVCLVIGCLARSLSVLHTRHTPVTHRDIKLENILISNEGSVKLCDLGSATTLVHIPDQSWSMNQRTVLEDELAKYSTPMYRAPEMLDTWSNFPVNQAVDIWATGLVLYSICFNKHPFDDSNKLAIVNGNYRIPPSDSRYRIFHTLINSMLSVDPRNRPSAGQVLDQLTAIAENIGCKTKGPLEVARTRREEPQIVQRPVRSASPLVSPDQAVNNVSLLKASASGLFSRLKDSSKAMVATVQQSLAVKDLDFHCITSRVGAMSFPAEGIESTYRNHIDDVRAMMESQHAGHYSVYNVSDRSYPASKFLTGKLVHAGWTSGSVPPLDTVLDLCSSILDFLSKDIRNVVVIHCLDGNSSTAFIVSALLIYTKFVSSVESAFAVFSGRRCDPVLTSCQVSSLRNLASLVCSSPPVLKSPFVTMSNLVIEPIPLFNKAGDGCRPYVEIYQGKDKVLSTLQEYNRMKCYSLMTGDEEATLPINVTVCGDVTIIISHVRQALGSLKPLKICQVQLHTSSLTPGRPSYSWSLTQLDCLAETARYSENFRLVMNCSTSEECSGRDVSWPDSGAAMLLFNSDQDYEAVVRLIPLAGTHQTGHSNFFVNNPELETKQSQPMRTAPAPPTLEERVAIPPMREEVAIQPTREDQSTFDLLGLNEPAVDNPPSNNSSDLLIPGFSSSVTDNNIYKSKPSDAVNLLEQTPTPSTESTFDFLGDFGKPNKEPSSSKDSLSDFFNSPSPGDKILLEPSIPRPTSSPNLQENKGGFDPFGDISNLTSSMSNHNLNSGKVPMSNIPKVTTQGASDQQPKPGNNSQQTGPNYNRSFFASQGPSKPSQSMNNGFKPKVATGTFDDLLGGFNPTSRDSNQNKTIGQMKKTEVVKSMDPDEAKIFDWKEGKARNIRTLLCSLHKVLWTGTRWNECGMHHLISPADVKKMYRKACLAVHPDKQQGTTNENLSKLIFMELNEAWSEFENDASQQNMFG